MYADIRFALRALASEVPVTRPTETDLKCGKFA